MRWGLGIGCSMAGVLVLGRFLGSDSWEWGMLLIVAWNLLPVILAGLLVWRGPWESSGRVMRAALLGFIMGAMGCSLWMSGDWWWTTHGGSTSSTAPLALLIYPVVEMFGAAVAMGVFALVAGLTGHKARATAGSV